MKTITNGTLSIAVKDHGAELASVKCNGREYLWQAHESFWKRHSPVLFPIVGAVWNGEYRSAGNVYKMGQHGFARDMDFTLVSESATEIWYELMWSDDTLRRFPYRFLLKIGYRIEGSSVRVMWHVENPGQTDLPFQIGAHPAFLCPIHGEENKNEEKNNSEKNGLFNIDNLYYQLFVVFLQRLLILQPRTSVVNSHYIGTGIVNRRCFAS